jgi:uracil-DNA glycosylase family 4
MLNCSSICNGCPAQAWGDKRIMPNGSGSSGIMLVGESPWLDEMRQERNFAGAAGAMLDRCLRRLGMERQQLIVANSAWCKAPRLGFFDKPSPLSEEVMEHCRPHLDQLIERTKPKVIVTLGGVALRRVCGVTGITNRHGYVHDSPYGIPVIPSWHPSYILQGNAKFQSVLMFALRRAQEVAKGEWQRSSISYVLDDYEAMQKYLSEPGWSLLALDIETPKSGKLDEETVDEEDASYTIIRASLSHTPNTACSFPWIEPFISLAREAVARAGVVIMHNENFDRPRLEAAGFRFGEVHDSMWEWHFLQSDLPKGLGFIAPFYYDGPSWKHLNDAQPDFYSACDADATIRCYLGIKRDLQAQGRWDRWLRHCVQVLPIFRRMGQRGILIDRTQQSALKVQLQAEYDVAYEKLQGEVPAAVLPVKVYKTGKQGGVEHRVKCDCQSKEAVNEQA